MPNEEKSNNQEKRPVGRPPKLKMPEPIPDTPDNIAEILMNTPPPKWTYEEEDSED